LGPHDRGGTTINWAAHPAPRPGRGGGENPGFAPWLTLGGAAHIRGPPAVLSGKKKRAKGHGVGKVENWCG